MLSNISFMQPRDKQLKIIITTNTKPYEVLNTGRQGSWYQKIFIMTAKKYIIQKTPQTQ